MPVLKSARALATPTAGMAIVALAIGCAPTKDRSVESDARIAAAPDRKAAPSWASVTKAALERAGSPGAIVVLDASGQTLATAEVAGVAEHPKTAARRPGSTVKPLMAFAALEAGVLAPQEVIACAGTRELAGASLVCHAEHGDVGLVPALAASCNHYAYEVGHRLAASGVRSALDRFGLGAGPREMPGTAARAIEWSVGHGAVAVTPLELARAYATFASLPHDAGSSAAVVRDGLSAVVNGSDGTGRRASVDGVHVVGKTGTARGKDESVQLAWFVGWAPAEAPEIVVAVQLETDGTGGQAAAPVAAEVFAALKL